MQSSVQAGVACAASEGDRLGHFEEAPATARAPVAFAVAKGAALLSGPPSAQLELELREVHHYY